MSDEKDVELKSPETNTSTVSSMPRPSREWKSCCFLVNPQAATFSVQVLFSLFLILFSAYKVSGIGPPEPLWVSILTSTIATWLPSPIHVGPGSSYSNPRRNDDGFHG